MIISLYFPCNKLYQIAEIHIIACPMFERSCLLGMLANHTEYNIVAGAARDPRYTVTLFNS